MAPTSHHQHVPPRSTAAPGRARRSALVGLLGAAVALGSSCGRDDLTTGASPGADSRPAAESTVAPGDTTTTAMAPAGPPTGWPDGLPLPTAVDPTGTPIPESLVSTADPVSGDVTMFEFVEADGVAMQSAFTGVGTWAETAFASDSSGTPCRRDDASRAALAGGLNGTMTGGSWGCSGVLPDGRTIAVTTAFDDHNGSPVASLVLTVVVATAR